MIPALQNTERQKVIVSEEVTLKQKSWTVTYKKVLLLMSPVSPVFHTVESVKLPYHSVICNSNSQAVR